MRSERPPGATPGVPATSDERLDELVERVRATARYARVVEPLIRRIGARELAARPTLKHAVKATQRRLHQVGGAYLEGRVRYDDWLVRLQRARDEGPETFRAACREMMRLHASTRERLPILDTLFREALAEIAPVSSVLDVACGLGPLAIPWMPLALGARYAAYDVYEDLTGFLHVFLPLAGVEGHAEARDVVADPPKECAQLGLVLKFVPNAEQLSDGATLPLLDSLQCSHLLVSFPAASLGGRDRAMPAQYEANLRRAIATREWTVRRYAYPQELAFLIVKG